MAYEMVFSSYLMQALQGQVVGREYAVAALVRSVTLALANRRYSDSSRPLATLLFAGPTGSGKMHVAQALASDLSKKQTDQLAGRNIGFISDEETDQEAPRQNLVVLEEIDNLLGAALVNRIDEIAVFDRLNEQNVITLLDRSLADFDQKLAASGIGFKIEEAAKTFLLRNCLDDPTHRVRQAISEQKRLRSLLDLEAD